MRRLACWFSWFDLAVHRRERLGFFKYETVLSFGAPVANKYKILVDGGGSMMFETNMVRLLLLSFARGMSFKKG
jgi:hypothetical protein